MNYVALVWPETIKGRGWAYVWCKREKKRVAATNRTCFIATFALNN